MDTKGVKTELVERLKAALEGKSAGKVAELAVDGEAAAEAPTKVAAEVDAEEVAEVDCEKPENLGADKAGGQEHLGSGKQDEREAIGPPEDIVNEDILADQEAAGAMPEEDAIVKEVDLEEKREAVEDNVPENENETEKSNSVEEEKVGDEAHQELTEKSCAADQVAPIGLRELRYF